MLRVQFARFRLVLPTLSIVHAVLAFYLLTLANLHCISIPFPLPSQHRKFFIKTQVLGCVRWLSMLVDCSHGRNGLTSKGESWERGVLATSGSTKTLTITSSK